MSEELKACPFCGSKDLNLVRDKYIICNSCNAFSPDDKAENRNELWNTRPLEDALRSRVEELERELDKAIKVGAQALGEVVRLREQVRWHLPDEEPEKYPILIEDEYEYGFEIYHTFKPACIKRWMYLPIPPEVNNE